MEKEAIIKNTVEYPDTILKEKLMGQDLYFAPQTALSPAYGGGLSSSAGGGPLSLNDSALLTAAVTNVAEIRAALIKVGILKSP